MSFHPSSDSVVVRVKDSHAAAPGSISGTGSETLSKFPKILFLIEDIVKCCICPSPSQSQWLF